MKTFIRKNDKSKERKVMDETGLKEMIVTRNIIGLIRFSGMTTDFFKD